MNIVFMGSPDFAIPSLEKIHQSAHTIKAVVSNVDKRRGRGSGKMPTPVKAKALELGLPVIEVEHLRSDKFAAQLAELDADLFVVVAFRILPKKVLEIPRIGSVNLHASLLPKFRGAAPIHWAVMQGEKKTGCTIFFLDEKVDTGRIILQKETAIGELETTGEVYERLMYMGSYTLVEALDLIEHGTYKAVTQNDEMATPAPKLFKEHCHLDFNRSAKEVHDHIRGLSPFPTAWAEYDGEKMNVYRSKPGPVLSAEAGEIIIKDGKFLVGCLGGTVEILEMQLPGKRRMRAEEYLKGYDFDGKLM